MKQLLYKYIKFPTIRNLILISLPIVFQMIIENSFRFIDTLMVGKLGSESLAAVGVCNHIFFAVIITYFAISSGLQIFITQYWGNKEIGKINKILSNFVTIYLFITLTIYFISIRYFYDILRIYKVEENIINLSYQYFKYTSINYIFIGFNMLFSTSIKSIEKTKLSLRIAVFSSLLNILLNYILIFGNFGFKKMGVAGAGLATLISNFLACLSYLYLFIKGFSGLKFVFKDLVNIDFIFFKKYFKYSLPLFLQEASWVAGQQTYTYFFSKLGTESIAARNILNHIDNLFLFVCWGFGIGTSILIGKDIGANKLKTAFLKSYKMVNFILKLSFFIALLEILFIYAVTPFFNINETIQNYCYLTSFVMAFFIMFRAYNITLIIGIFRVAGDTLFTFFIESSSLWFGIPVLIILAYFFKLSFPVLWFVISLEEILKVYISFKRYFSKKWINRVI